ncbi:16S rRNA (guanine(527)-N(7))-methyltransferase RsmG [soil metagenome]
MSEPVPVPLEAAALFPVKQFPLVVRYADWLTGQGVLRGLIGPREAPRIWERHLLNCAAVAPMFTDGSSVADIGSGAGLPGLVIAMARPDVSVTLVEPLLRRTTFLDEVVDDLGLTNVEVVRSRADALHGKRLFDYVTSRAVAPLGRLLQWSMPLVAPGGAMVAMKGGSVAGEIADAAGVLASLGCAGPTVLSVGEGETRTSVLTVAWADPARVGSGSARRSTKPVSTNRPKRGPGATGRRR